MDITSKTFLAILKAALSSKEPDLDREITPEQWQQIFRLAGIHKVLPLFYEAVYSLSGMQKEQALLAAVRHQVKQQVVVQSLRTADFLELNSRLQEAQVQPLVVKGIICRNLYPMPDHRPSGDEDVLIPADRFAMAHQVLTDFGMETEESGFDAYEVPYRKAGSPLYLELHRSLFPPASGAYGDMNRFFEKVFDRAVPVDIRGRTVYTLDYTDHLFYLICHALKHFLHSGFGIRQVCDIVLFANAYGERVDWLQLLENCRAIHGEKFAAALFRIGSEYLIFDPDLAAYPDIWRKIPVDIHPMLEDLLAGGLYGDASLSRKHSSHITLDAVEARKQGREAKGAVAASLFPPAANLEGRYPYLKDHPYLLPAAWCSRIWEYARNRGSNRGGNTSEALKIGRERIELMKLYGILE